MDSGFEDKQNRGVVMTRKGVYISYICIFVAHFIVLYELFYSVVLTA